MKLNINLNSLITAIVGGLFINFYLPISIVFIYILKNFNKDVALIIFILYLIAIGFFISFNSIYTNWDIVFFIVIPHIIVLQDILSEIEENQHIIFAFLVLISYFYKYLYFALVLLELYIIYKKFDVKGILIPIILTILYIFILWQYFYIINMDNLYQIIVLIGIGLVSFFIFLFKK